MDDTHREDSLLFFSNGIKNVFLVLEMTDNNGIVNPDYFVLIAVYDFLCRVFTYIYFLLYCDGEVIKSFFFSLSFF